MPINFSRANLVALIVACANFMQTLDGNIVGTALPQVARSFGVAPERLSIGITAYLLSLAVFVPISGWVADRYGSRLVFQTAVGLFTLGSLFCGISQNLPEFVAARALQGFGAAMITPVGRLVVLRTATKAELIGALTFITVPTQIGPAVGPPLGGLITTYASWRWVFLINLPIGIIGMLLAYRYMDNFRERDRFPLDWLGFIISTVSMVSLLYALDAVARGGVSPIEIGGFLLLGAFSGLAVIRHSRRHAHPLIDLSLVRIPTFSANFWAGTWFRAGSGALPFLLPLMMQTVFGMTAFASGLITFVSAIGSIVMRANATIFLRRFGFRDLMLVNGVISSATILVCGFLSPSWPIVVILAVLLIGGLFQALQLFSLNSIAYAEVAPPQMSAATSLAQLMQQLGKTGGVAIAAILLHQSQVWRGGASLGPTDFLIAFAGVALLSVIGVPSYAKLTPEAGAELTGYVSKKAKPAVAESPTPPGE